MIPSLARPSSIMFPGRSRLFENLTPAWLACPAFRSALASFRAAAGVRPRAPVQVHAIRTLARPGASGEPAPEGVHRDGFRVLGILCVGRDGVEGAVTELHASKDGAGKGGGEAPLFREALEPGTGVLVNDRPGSGVYHYTSSVSAARPPATGTRDVLVFVV